MIVFDLKCTQGHVFEVWFRSSRDFEEQLDLHEIECPLCGDTHVSKAAMAPNIGGKAKPGPTPPAMIEADELDRPSPPTVHSFGVPALPDDLQTELNRVVAKVQRHVEDTCDYVGRDFAEEARKIHYGEAQERGIYGEATIEESVELIEEGIDVMPLPTVRRPGQTDA